MNIFIVTDIYIHEHCGQYIFSRKREFKNASNSKRFKSKALLKLINSSTRKVSQMSDRVRNGNKMLSVHY